MAQKTGSTQAVAQFLAQQRDAITCDEVPASLQGDGLDGPQRASRYLLLTVAGAWALSGPDWAGIDRLMALMFGLSIAFAYFACRFTMSRVVALGVAVLIMISPLHLENLADVRDYSKAPFLAASLFLIAAVVTRAWKPRVLALLGAIIGAILGFGFGMRTDVIIDLVMVVAALLGFVPGRLTDSWKPRLAAATACVAAFAIVAAPLMKSFDTGTSPWHWALLGYAQDSDRALGVVGAPYETGHFYSDSYVATIVDAYWGRLTGSESQVSVGLPGYSEASRRYYTTLLSTFPADALIRGWASVIKILELPFSGSAPVRVDLLPAWLASVMNLAQGVLARFEDLSVVFFVLLVLAVSAFSPRLAILVAGLAVFIGASPAIQFQQRHVFHLEILSLWALGFAASEGFAMFRAWAWGTPSHAESRIRLWRPVAAGVALLLVVVVPVRVLRAYQQRSAAELLAAYDEAAVEPIGALLPRPPGQRSMLSDMLVAEVSDGCPLEAVQLTFKYVARDPVVDFSRTYEIETPRPGRSTKLYVPVFQTGGGSPDPDLLKFDRVEVPEAASGCVTHISRFTDPDRFPLLLPAVLPDDWRTTPLYQRLYGSAGAGSPEDAARVARDPNAPRFRGTIEYQARIADVGSDGSVTVDGFAESSGSYLVVWRAQPFEASRVLVVDGHVDRGGATVGLVDASGWAVSVSIDAPGAFRARVRAPRAGLYQLVIANALRGGSLRNQFAILRIAESRAAPGLLPQDPPKND